VEERVRTARVGSDEKKREEGQFQRTRRGKERDETRRTLSLLRRIESVERRGDDLEDRSFEVDHRLSTRSEDVFLMLGSS